MGLLKFLVSIIMALVVLVNAAPANEDDMTPLNITLPFNASDIAGYDPSFEYHDYSTVQVWMGKDKRTVGTMVGPKLYDTMWYLLDRGCPSTSSQNTCHDVPSGSLTFTSRCMVKFPGDIRECTTEIFGLVAKWENEKIRRLLIGAVAGALEAATNQQVSDPTNCYAIAEQKGCNVGDVVRVNFPKSNSGVDNYMHIRIFNYNSGYGRWDCCAGSLRKDMDKSIDRLGKEITAEFPQWWNREFTRDSRCIINGWEACKG